MLADFEISQVPTAGRWQMTFAPHGSLLKACIFFRFSANYFLFILLILHLRFYKCTQTRFIMNDSEDFQEGVNTRIFHNNNYLSNVVNAFLYSFDCAPYSFLIFFSSSTLCLPPEFDKRRNTLLVLPVWRSCDSMLVILFSIAA